MQVRELMSRPVEGIGPDDRVVEAARRMRDCNVGVLPVREEDRIVGIVTDRDIVLRAIANGVDARRLAVRTVMTPRVVACRADQDIKETAALMEKHHVRRLPVTDLDGRLIGMLSLGDFPRRAEGSDVVAEILEAVAARAK